MRRSARCLPLALLLVAGIARSQAPSTNQITIGTVDSLWSGALKERRKVWVWTPVSYNDSSYTQQRYPVLYLLDGDGHFHSVTGLLQVLGSGINGTYAVPEMIVVAILNTDRTRDLTPTHAEKGFDGKPNPELKTSGGAGNFLSFIKAELIPHIDSVYRTTPYRVFVGHSFGGITALQALYTIPETFNAYVAIDPSLWWDNRRMLLETKDYFKRAKLNNRALYVAQANTIAPDDTAPNVHYASITQFNSIAEAYKPAGLRYGYRFYPGDDHGSVPLIAEYDALRFIFADYKLNLMRALEDPTYITEHFSTLSSQFGYAVKPPEGMLDMLGQFELGRDTTKAITLLQMNAELYPKSARVYDGLGSAWMAKGDVRKASEFFARALAINPKDSLATEMLKKKKGAGKL
jgi:predicted alpha/beta superfamily hydrolase